MHGVSAQKADPQPSGDSQPGREAAVWQKRIHALTGSIALPVAVLVVLLIVVTIRNDRFLSLGNLQVQVSSTAPILLLAIGQTLVILAGGIDLSSAANAALATITITMWSPSHGVGGLMLALLLSTGIGLVNGLVHAHFQVPSFVVTLGTLGLASGLAQVFSGNRSISLNEGYGAVSWLGGYVGRLPNDAGFTLLVLVAIALSMRYLPHPYLVKAVGSSELAALVAGVPTKKIKVWLFTASGLLSGLAGMVLTAQNIGGDPAAAQSLLLPSIAAVLVGGTAITGGRGGLVRTLVGALIITVLRNGLGLIGVPDAYTQIIYGGVVLVAVGASLDRRRGQIVK